MASVGLRAGSGLRGPVLQSVVSAIYGSSRYSRKQFLQRAIAPATIGPGLIRHYSQSREQHFVVNEFGLLSGYVPTPWSQQPSIFSAAGLKAVQNRIVEGARELFSLVTIKYYLSGWKGADFAEQAEELYSVMNEAYAQGDLRSLEAICLPTMYASLKNDIKKRNTSFEWRKVRTVTPAKSIQIRCGRLTSDFTIGQVVVRIDQEQAAIPLSKRRGGAAAGASLNKPAHVTEYVVFQKVVTDPASPWRIYGKMDVPKWDQPSSSK
ncbi:hypothetical protein GGI15_000081 [Coemansia interrupta]|uniref:Large ribosomal subunit protein mL45 n=1 Tax=Coemansia interrupta TaxID=1126814 RepID=A0A9W8HKX6_9FUNG|nr:hypothetical protein GGI15_000081 [Coemansia interrupta]